MRALVYTRISLDRQGDSLSPARQEAQCRTMAEARGWEVVRVLADRDASAFSARARRPAFDLLKQLIRAGEADVVMAHAISRFARNTVRFHEFLELADAHNVKVACVSDPVDTTTPAGRLMVTITAALAQLESEMTSSRVRGAHEVAAARGDMHLGGNRAWGYDRRGAVKHDEAVIVREVTSRVLAGASLRSVARDLNGRGDLTSMDNEWTSQTLGQALRSPRLAGLRKYRGDLLPGNWEPVIDRAEWDRLQAALSRPLRERRAQPHLLTGLLVCGRCGTKLKAYMSGTGTGYSKFNCPPDPGSGGCGSVGLSKNAIEPYVFGEWLRLLSTSEMLPTPDMRERERLQSRRDMDMQSLSELIQERYVRRTIPVEAFEPARAQLQARVDAADQALAEIESVEAPVVRPGSVDDLTAWWEAASVPERRRALAELFREIVIAPVGRGGNRFKPERVTFRARWTNRRGFTAWAETDLRRLEAMTPGERDAEEARVSDEAWEQEQGSAPDTP